jgi:hypothetical protein
MTPPDVEGVPARAGTPSGTPSAIKLWMPVPLGISVGIATELAAFVPVLLNLTTFTGVWVTTGALLGRRSSGPRAAALAATVYLLSMVAGFYATRAVVQGGDQTRLLIFWTALGVVGGPVIGVLGAASRGTGRWAAAGLACLTGLLLAEAVIVGTAFHDPDRFGLVVFDAVAGLCFWAFAPTTARVRRQATMFLPVAAALGAVAFYAAPVLHRLVGI